VATFATLGAETGIGAAAVQKVAVVGLPDDRLSEVAVAYVQGRTEAVIDAEDVRGHCRGKIMSFKLPRHVVIVDAFSMTESGKIRKAELREDARKQFAERAL
jgi:fatty-acyl-CoA synthase